MSIIYDACEAARHGPPSWRCPDCRHPVTGLGPLGRPAHLELGHAAACTRLARDQAADDRDYPDPGQLIAWDMRWRRTSVLAKKNTAAPAATSPLPAGTAPS